MFCGEREENPLRPGYFGHRTGNGEEFNMGLCPQERRGVCDEGGFMKRKELVATWAVGSVHLLLIEGQEADHGSRVR